jgi:hypothetical protein
LCLWSYHPEYIGSHLISEAKNRPGRNWIFFQ